MFSTWLSFPDPVTETFRRRQWGSVLGRAKAFFNDLDQWEELLIIGFEGINCKQIMDQLDQLVFPFNRLKIGYLGNIKSGADVSSVQEGLKQLQDAGKTIILIHPDPRYWLSALNTLLPSEEPVHAGLITRQIPILLESAAPEFFLNEFLKFHPERSIKLSLLGIQEAVLPTKAVSECEFRGYDLQNLGVLQGDIHATEPYLRDLDWLGLNMSVVRGSDFSSVQQPFPTGLSIEHCCQLVRFAGMSEKVNGISIFGFLNNDHFPVIDATGVALLIWYFVDGFADRKDDFPKSTRYLSEYVVAIPTYPDGLRFWKSDRTNRWWFELPFKKHSKSRHRLLPCSFNDYQETSKGELPDRLLKAFMFANA